MAEVCGLDPPLALAYEFKEAFRALMEMGRSGDVAAFIAGLDIFGAWCSASKLAPFVTVANSFRSWRAEIINYARTHGASNGFAEAMNHLIKNQKRQAHGYRTWGGFRAQMLWCFGEAVDPDTGEIVALRSLPRGGEPVTFNLDSRRAEKGALTCGFYRPLNRRGHAENAKRGRSRPGGACEAAALVVRLLKPGEGDPSVVICGGGAGSDASWLNRIEAQFTRATSRSTAPMTPTRSKARMIRRYITCRNGTARGQTTIAKL